MMKKLAGNALLWCGYDESPRMPVACIKAPKTGLLSTPLNAISMNALLIPDGSDDPVCMAMAAKK